MQILTGKRPPESASVPAWLSAPRSAVSNVNRLLKAAEGLGALENPIPDGVQDTVSALGAGFAAFNIGAELYEQDWMGALEDTANGSVSLLGGVKLFTDHQVPLDGLSLGGAALNTAFAARDFADGRHLEGSLKVANSAGLTLTALGGGVAESVGLALLGVSGLVDLAHDQVRAARERDELDIWGFPEDYCPKTPCDLWLDEHEKAELIALAASDDLNEPLFNPFG